MEAGYIHPGDYFRWTASWASVRAKEPPGDPRGATQRLQPNGCAREGS
jgi:hypothetical protein